MVEAHSQFGFWSERWKVVVDADSEVREQFVILPLSTTTVDLKP